MPRTSDEQETPTHLPGDGGAVFGIRPHGMGAAPSLARLFSFGTKRLLGLTGLGQ